MKKLAVILAILMAASSFSACSQAENRLETTSIPSVATPSEIPERRTESDSHTETENAEKSAVSAFQEQSGTYPTTPKKADVSPTSPQQSRVSENSKPDTTNVKSENKPDSTVASKQSNSPSRGNTTKQISETKQSVTTAPAEKEQVKPTPKPTEAPKATQPPKPQPKPTEPPTEKEEVDYSQIVSNLIAYGQQLGMVYNGSLGLGNAGWFPPTDISSYTDTAGATAACYGDVDYVPYYYAGLGTAPSDIMFNVIASGGQIYVVYG